METLANITYVHDYNNIKDCGYNTLSARSGFKNYKTSPIVCLPVRFIRGICTFDLFGMFSSTTFQDHSSSGERIGFGGIFPECRSVH